MEDQMDVGDALDVAREALDGAPRGSITKVATEYALALATAAASVSTAEDVRRAADTFVVAGRVLPEIAMLLQQLNYPLLHVADDGSVSKVADTTRARFTADGRPRTNREARDRLALIQDALTGYEAVHGDDWPCLHPAVTYVDEALEALADAEADA